MDERIEQYFDELFKTWMVHYNEPDNKYLFTNRGTLNSGILSVQIEDIIQHYQYEITFYQKKTKKGILYVLNGDFYQTPDEIITELNRIGIK